MIFIFHRVRAQKVKIVLRQLCQARRLTTSRSEMHVYCEFGARSRPTTLLRQLFANDLAKITSLVATSPALLARLLLNDYVRCALAACLPLEPPSLGR
jgi:hypothetical protein